MSVLTHPSAVRAADQRPGGFGAIDELDQARATRVLLVVAEAQEREQLAAMLGVPDMRTVGVADGWDAMREVALAAGAGAPFDLVLADAELPGMTGVDLARRLREAQHGKRPLLLLARPGASAPPGSLIRPLSAAALQAACRAALAAGVPAPAPAADPLEGLAGVDVGVGRASTRGNDQLYRRLLLLFLKSQRDFSTRFAAAQAGDDRSAPTRMAHDLKATAGSLGMLGLQSVAAELEIACQNGDVPPALVDAVQRSLEPILAGLERLSAQAG